MTLLYKLTDQDGYTRRGMTGETLWAEGVTHSVEVKGTELCTSDVIHAYTDPLVALFLNPIHADIPNPRLWECEGAIVADDNGLKVGVHSLTVVKELEVPEVTVINRVAFGLLCALEGCSDPTFVKFAQNWLSGQDRSAAWAAAWAAEAAWAARAAEAAASSVAAHIDLPTIAAKALEVK